MNLENLIIKTVYAADDVIGTINTPAGVPSSPSQTTTVISALIRFIVIVAGIFALWQFIQGGLQYVTSGGDKGKLTEAQNKITMSILGLVIIAASFIIIAIVSQILFGSFTAILAPKLQSI